ncbi:cell adhesion molecule CEACAM15-like isoform 2-T2 [Anomaloglossus baeobatrachus]
MRADVIAVLILHIDLINGKIIIEPNPKYPIVKESVTLSVTGIKGDIMFFSWFKGPKATSENQIFTYMNGSLLFGNRNVSRVSAFANGSLQIKDLQVGDRGNYIVKVQTEAQEDADVYLNVYETVGKPVITASHSEIKENDFFSLTCASANADRIVWVKSTSKTIKEENGNIVTHENGTIMFANIKSNDEGRYKCRAENLVSTSSSEVYTLSISHFHDAYKSAGVTAGIVSGTVLGILIIFIVSFLFYKRCSHQEKKKRAGPPMDGPAQYAIYNNILDPTAELESKDEPLYMCLEFASEGAYIELQK